MVDHFFPLYNQQNPRIWLIHSLSFVCIHCHHCAKWLFFAEHQYWLYIPARSLHRLCHLQFLSARYIYIVSFWKRLHDRAGIHLGALYLGSSGLHENIDNFVSSFPTNLKHMSPSTSDTLLSDQQQAITIKCSNDSSRVKVDFIRRIPTELLCTVLSHLDPNHLVTECLLVSQLWRERLLHCPKVWSQIRVDRMEFSPRALLLVGKYIQLLKVHHCGGRWFTMLFEYMIAGAFPKLRTLKLSPSMFHAFFLY